MAPPNLFMLFAPLEGWRHVEVTDRHTAIDYARVLKELADIHFAHAKTIVLMQDNLNIHSKASLYEAFPAAEASGWSSVSSGITRPSTAVGSTWQNPNSVSCPPNASTAAFPTSKISSTKSRAWEHQRNAHHTKADWQFTTKTARVKLKHLYPSI